MLTIFFTKQCCGLSLLDNTTSVEPRGGPAFDFMVWRLSVKQGNVTRMHLVDEIQGYAPTVESIVNAVVFGSERNKTYEELATFVDTFGARFTGSDTLERSIDYMVELLRSRNLEQVHTEPVEVPRWIRGTEKAWMTAPRRKRLAILGLGFSAKTACRGLTAEALVVDSFQELQENRDKARGRIVVFNQKFVSYSRSKEYRLRGPAVAANLGAVAVLVRSLTPFSIGSPHTGRYSLRQVGHAQQESLFRNLSKHRSGNSRKRETWRAIESDAAAVTFGPALRCPSSHSTDLPLGPSGDHAAKSDVGGCAQSSRDEDRAARLTPSSRDASRDAVSRPPSHPVLRVVPALDISRQHDSAASAPAVPDFRLPAPVPSSSVVRRRLPGCHERQSRPRPLTVARLRLRPARPGPSSLDSGGVARRCLQLATSTMGRANPDKRVLKPHPPELTHHASA
ncbi:hypothetical protein HPB49_022976 [Dermacentor silvarum]|uniref:Uncharacterized protein n=1 Tax=Dermacentor silvarum TaxID=543639 RepID=A0ACB8D8T8_DERSI|nr:hypothetical protein HPB49_022976 [Dermacentor silvarum]